MRITRLAVLAAAVCALAAAPAFAQSGFAKPRQRSILQTVKPQGGQPAGLRRVNFDEGNEVYEAGFDREPDLHQPPEIPSFTPETHQPVASTAAVRHIFAQAPDTVVRPVRHRQTELQSQPVNYDGPGCCGPAPVYEAPGCGYAAPACGAPACGAPTCCPAHSCCQPTCCQPCRCCHGLDLFGWLRRIGGRCRPICSPCGQRGHACCHVGCGHSCGAPAPCGCGGGAFVNGESVPYVPNNGSPSDPPRPPMVP